MTVWLIRAGRGCLLFPGFSEKGFVGLSGERLGELRLPVSRTELRRRFATAYPDVPTHRREAWGAQLLRFASEMRVGDTAVTYDVKTQTYWLGSVTGSYEWAPRLCLEAPHVRRVAWTHTARREALDLFARKGLGAIQAMFVVRPAVAKALLSMARPLSNVQK